MFETVILAIAVILGLGLFENLYHPAEGFAKLGQGIQTGISDILSPQIHPTFSFVPEFGLRFGIGGLTNPEKKDIKKNSRLNLNRYWHVMK